MITEKGAKIKFFYLQFCKSSESSDRTVLNRLAVSHGNEIGKINFVNYSSPPAALPQPLRYSSLLTVLW